MKQPLLVTLCLLMVLLLAAPSGTVAQANDTLVVYATPSLLNTVIRKDTVAGGAQAHKVYRLVSRDTTYVYDATMTIKSDVTILGVLDPTTGRPPCIQPTLLPNNQIPGNPFTFNGKGKRATLKNLYLLGLATDGNASGDGIAIQVIADSIRLIVDNVVFEEWLTFAIGYNGNWCDFFISNSKFRNMVHSNQWYIGEVLRNMWPGAAYTDTVKMVYNTMFCVNGYASATVTKYYTRYFEFNHNNVVYTFKNTFFEFNVTDAKFNNNIFYGAWAGGISKSEYPWWDQLWSPEVGSIIDMDTLDLAKDSLFNPTDKASPNFRLLSEAKRKVEVKNNVYFWPDTLRGYWKVWNDTAHVDSVYTPTWMNTRTTNMFTNKTTWPGFTQSNNLNIDPGFGTSIPAVLTQATRGFLSWFKLCRTGTLSTTYWGYTRTAVTSALNWKPTWPLPEANDMKYSNATAKNASGDGLANGDPNWFTGVTGVGSELQPLPDEFTLSEAYPNPFNPSTKIDYTLRAEGLTNLRVFNILGQVVKVVVNDVRQPAGLYTVQVDMSDAPSGVYVYVLEQGGNRLARKMVLMK